MKDFGLIRAHFEHSHAVMANALASEELLSACTAIAEVMTRALRAGGKVMFAGNGGSAGDAQHLAGEFVSRLNFDRAPLAAIALTVDTSVITAIGNDYGYEQIFVRQVRALGREGDVLVGISTSGRSPNIVAALKAAREMDMITVGFGGQGDTLMKSECDYLLAVPSRLTPLIQQVYMVAGHAICGQVEVDLFGQSGIS
jgi:D-sedoheptulose 7-phosphate isomerase